VLNDEIGARIDDRVVRAGIGTLVNQVKELPL
jgi:hypothetical protein